MDFENVENEFGFLDYSFCLNASVFACIFELQVNSLVFGMVKISGRKIFWV